MAAPTPASKRSTAKSQATPESQTQFLYLILKQLDLKSVNWQDVADGIGIKNGHAARMRWCRFKAQTEGLPTQSTKKKRTGEKDGGKEGNCKKSAGLVGGMQEAMMDDRESRRVKMEHAYSGGPQMPYPPPNAAWALYPPGNCMGPPPAPGMPHMLKHEHGMASTKMEPNGDMQPHAPPFGPWLGPLPDGAPMGPPRPMHENMTPTQIFAMHGYGSNIDLDDLPIKQSQLSVPGTVSMADLHMHRTTEELGTNDIDMQNGIDAARSCPAVDEPSSSNNPGVDHEQVQLAPASANQPSPRLHSIPFHQPGPDSPSPSSTDDTPNEPAQQPIAQQQPTHYDTNQQQQTSTFTLAPHFQQYNMPFTYPYGPPPPMPPHPPRLAQQPPHQPGYPYMPSPYGGGGYPHAPQQLMPSYRGMPAPTAYPLPFQPGFPMGQFDGFAANPMQLQPLSQMHMHVPQAPPQQQQHQLPFGPIPEYIPFGAAPATTAPVTTTLGPAAGTTAAADVSTTNGTAGGIGMGAACPAAEMVGNNAHADAHTHGEKGGEEGTGTARTGTGTVLGAEGKALAAVDVGDEGGSGSEKGAKSGSEAEAEVRVAMVTMPLKPQFVVHSEEEGTAAVNGAGVSDGMGVGA